MGLKDHEAFPSESPLLSVDQLAKTIQTNGHDRKPPKEVLVMRPIAEAVLELIKEKGYQLQVVDGDLVVTLPSGFGELVIGDLPRNDTIIGLVGFQWHTHGDLLASMTGLPMAEAIAELVDGIFSGEHWMVEEIDAGGCLEKYIVYSYYRDADKDRFLSKVPAGYKARIVEPKA
jgi:hypothetical protein